MPRSYLACAALSFFLITACSKRMLNVNDAEKPITFNVTATPGAKRLEIEVRGLLSSRARLHLFKPADTQTPWKTLELWPVVVSGMPMGITPVRFREKYEETQIVVKYEPGKKTQGHLEIQYRFE